ncbi:MAG: polyprenyl synthetase family protein [Planctomycetota bacterium]
MNSPIPSPSTDDSILPGGGLDAFVAFARRESGDVEAALQAMVPMPDGDGPAVLARDLAAAMRHALFPGGKRLRPMLALIGCAATGGDRGRALRPAAALELLHTYSLVHDDLPCMDDDDLRRGRPTVHRAFDEATAVLAGDALLTLAFEVVAEGGSEAVRALARAAGALGMVGGQQADMRAERGRVEPNLPALQWIHDRKTGALIRASLEVGALAGGGDLAALPALREYGALLGRAFQIADDCLDVEGSAAQLGKNTGQDAAAGKLTYPSVVGVAAGRTEARRLAEAAAAMAPAACTALSADQARLDSAVRLLQDAAWFSVSREA